MGKKLICLGIVSIFIFSGCESAQTQETIIEVTQTKTLEATSVRTNTITTIPTVTQTFIPSSTNTPKPTRTPTLTETPEGWIPQIYIGISPDAVNVVDGCGFAEEYGGNVVFWTGNYGSQDNPLDYWEANPDIPSPEVIHGTRVWRGNLDVCVYPDQPIVFQMDDGVVTEIREEGNDHLVKVLITELNYELIYAHLIPNEELTVGMKIMHGDLIGYTNPSEILGGQYNVLNVGIFCEPNTNPLNFGYCGNQGLMLIGPDGKVNLLRSDDEK